jgi:RHS repeat-associated protein
MSWSTTNATSLSHVCSASGTGYTVNESLAVSGSRSMMAQAGWVSYPSTCTWTATGPGGTTTVSETLTTSAAPTPKPGISVSRSSSLVAGQSFTTTWSTTDATSLTHVCTASGTGYTVNEVLAVNGSSVATAQSGLVGYPSSCTWTASGAGGSTIFTETMTTVAGVNSSVTYIYTDGLGSPVARTDANGTVISRTRYEPYGYVASGVQPTIGFTGHVNDVDTGLTYMQQRYYDPVAGRFLSIDPVVADANNGTNFNRYVYVDNNPYRYTDPEGREKEIIEPPPIILPGPLPIIIRPVVIIGKPDPLSENSFVSPVSNSRSAGDVMRTTILVTVQTYCTIVPMLCGQPLWNSAPDQPDENNLVKIPENKGNKAAQDAGYIDAHDAMSGRGDSKMNIYNDKTTGRKWLWDGKKGSEKEIL